MTDIVGKLRIFASPRNPSRTMDKATITEAADEIERLTEIVGRIRGYYNGLQVHHEKFCLPSCGMAYGVLLDPAEFSVCEAEPKE